MVLVYSKEERLQLNLSRGILVDEQDVWLLEEYTWTIAQHGYAVRAVNFDGRWAPTYLHHYIMGQPIWHNEDIDHCNRTKLDNRRSNLRWTTHSENLTNNGQKPGPSGARSVLVADNGRFRVQIKRAGIHYYLGTFDTLDEAVATRDEWLYQYNKENV